MSKRRASTRLAGLGFELAGAVAGFGEAAKVAVEKTMEELKEMQRQQASSIVVPGRENSKIQMP